MLKRVEKVKVIEKDQKRVRSTRKVDVAKESIKNPEPRWEDILVEEVEAVQAVVQGTDRAGVEPPARRHRMCRRK